MPSSINFIIYDVDLIEKYCLMSPMVTIRQSRLALLARLVAKGPKCIIDLLSSFWDRDFGWVSAVRSDLAWFSCSGYFNLAILFVPVSLVRFMLSPLLPLPSCARFVSTLLRALLIMMSPCLSLL